VVVDYLSSPAIRAVEQGDTIAAASDITSKAAAHHRHADDAEVSGGGLF
jgi:hypothetical protein